MMEEINKCIDKFFPKGKDKRRGDALILQAIAYLEGKKVERERILEELDMIDLKVFLTELKEKDTGKIIQIPKELHEILIQFWNHIEKGLRDVIVRRNEQ